MGENDAATGNVWAGDIGGKFYYCLARQREIVTSLSFFPGYPGTGTPFLWAMAMKWKAEHGLPWGTVQAPEGNKDYYLGLKKPYTRFGLDKYANLMNMLVTKDNVETLCPSKSVDLWDSDVSCSTPNLVWEILFRA